MSTALQGVYTAPTCTNLTQNFSITEGATAVDLQPFVLTTGVNYSRVYTLTMTIAAPYQAANISLVCGALNGLAFTRVGNVYTLSSEYTAANGVKINNWAYFKIALQSINVSLSNSDFSDSFTITSVLTDGSTTLSGVINVYTQAQIDVVGATQTVYMPMASNNMSLVDMGGVNLSIADPAQANKTYRVTLTVNEPAGSNLYFHIRNNLIGYDSGWQKTIVLSGTQTYINSLLVPTVGDTASGIRLNNYAPDFSGYVGISYLQEVLTTNEAVSVPYVQEGGTIGVQVAYTAPMSLGGNITYVEDSSVTFDLGNITDPAGFYWAHETCGQHAGYNCYTLTATALGTYTAENPVQLTFSGDVAINNTVTFTGTRDQVNSAINALTLIPPADHVGQIDIGVVLTRGNTPLTILNTVIAATCSSTHGDINIIAGTAFIVGTTDINFGSITDLAVGKQYTITIDAVTDSATRGALSDTTGTGVWNATGGVNGFGRLTISGSKSVVNASLAALRYTTAVGATGNETQSFVYTQTQTTNNILQGTVNILFANSIIWNSGNGVNAGQNAFVYDQDKPETFNLAAIDAGLDTVTSYTVKLIFSTPLTVDNLGGVTGWTRETDYIWTKSGVKADLNAALAAVAFTPPAALVSNFTLDIAIYSGATLITSTATLSSTKTVFIRSMISVAWSSSSLSYDQDTATTWSLATLNTYSAPRVYTLRLITSVDTGGSIAGWTTINSTTFERSDTRANLQTALNSLVFTPTASFVSNFTFNLEAYRSSLLLYTSATLSNSKSITRNNYYSITPNVSTLIYDQDNTVTFNFATLSSNFNNNSTYTITLSSNRASVGTLTGWTTESTTTFIKTDTGANLITALGALQFVPIASQRLSFTLTATAVKSSTTIATSTAKTITIGVVYSITFVATAQTFDQDRTKTFTNVILPNAAFSNENIYTFTLTTTSPDVGIFTGWTQTSSKTYTKTDTGANLITACNSLVYTSPISFVPTFYISVSAVRGGLTVTTPSDAKIFTLLNRYSLYATSRSVVYNVTSNTLSSVGSLNSWFVDTDTYVLTATFRNPATSSATISGSGWSVVSGTVLTVTGTRTEIMAVLTSGVTLTTPALLNRNGTLTLIISKTGITIQEQVATITIINTPYITLDQWKPTAAGIQFSDDFVGYVRNMDSYKNPPPNDVYNRDLCDTIRVGNIPADSTLYQLVVETTNTNIFGSISSSALTWSEEVVGRWVSSAGTSTEIADALVDVKLRAGLFAPTTSASTSNIIVKLRGQAPFVETVSTIRTMKNNAEIVLMFTNFNGFYFFGDSGVFRIGMIQEEDYSFMDPTATYTIQINLGGTGTTVVGWTKSSGNSYTLSGNIAFLNDKLGVFSMTATIQTARYVSFDLYYGGVLMSTQGHEIRTN